MKTTLLTVLVLGGLTAAAGAQVKVLNPVKSSLPVKDPVGAPAPSSGGSSLLAVGGSDDCATASTANAITGTGAFAVTTVGATASPETATGCTGTHLDVWFYWTATFSGSVTVDLCGGTTADTTLVVWPDNNGGACPTGTTAIGCNDDTCGLQSQVVFVATSGTSYFFQVGAYGTTTTYSGTLNVSGTPAPPANDDCSAPTLIAGLGTFPVTTVSATNGAPDATGCPNTNLDVWYRWTSTVTGSVIVSLCGGTTADTTLVVWPDNNGGACPTGTTAIGCNDDSLCGAQSEVTFTAVAGTDYFFQLGSYFTTGTYTGTFTVSTPTPPPPPPINDDCSTPIVLNGTVTIPFDNTSATTGTQGQAEAICLFFSQTAINKDVWYTWTPTVSGTVTVSTCGLLTGTSTLDSKIAVYDGAGCPVTAAIACNDDAGNPTGTACVGQGLASTATFTAVCGQQYTIQLGQYLTAATSNLVGSLAVTEDPNGTPCVPQPTAFCFGDGTLTDHTTPCPCANNGAAGNGCANSANANGANLTVTGSVPADTAVLNGSGMPLTVSCIYLQGDALADTVFGDGVRCTGGSLLRLRTKTNVGGASSFPDSVETVTLAQRGGVTIGSGATRYYQTYYRNSAAAFCPPETFNVTNGMTIVW